MEVVAKEEFKKVFDGKSEDGITAEVNTWNKKQQKIEEKFADPSSETYQNAEKLAKKHVEELVKNIRINDGAGTPTVDFKREREGA